MENKFTVNKSRPMENL